MVHSIDILLAVYNNSAFLADQLHSLMNQTFQDFHIIARDDCSTDNSYEILQAFSDQNPGKFSLIKGIKNLGAKGNFSALLCESKAPYIMFCDADDIWFEDKIECTFAFMKQNEAQFDADFPLLVHTDLTVVDKALQIVDSSFWTYSHIHPEHVLYLNRLIIQNSVTGCATMINRPLLEVALPIPCEAIMHDWWLALVACTLGHVAIFYRPTLWYRQHGNNDTGAKNWRDSTLYFRRIKEAFSKNARQKMKKGIMATITQAEAFYNRYQLRLKESDRKILRGYVWLKHAHWIHKRVLLLQHRFFKNSFLKNLGLFLLV